jgi:hypothetical protein
MLRSGPCAAFVLAHYGSEFFDQASLRFYEGLRAAMSPLSTAARAKAVALMETSPNPLFELWCNLVTRSLVIQLRSPGHRHRIIDGTIRDIASSVFDADVPRSLYRKLRGPTMRFILRLTIP